MICNNTPRFGSQTLSFFTVINRFSGSGQSVSLFKKIVKPIWDRHNIEYDICLPDSEDHSIETLKNLKTINLYNAVITVGGDGTLVSVLTGLLQNPFFTTATALGIIATGSGNGLNASLGDPNIAEAAEIMACMHTKKLDLFKYTQKNMSKIGFLAVTAALIARIDIKTEPCRFLGSFRFTLGAIMCVWNNKAFKGEFSFLPTDLENECSEIPPLYEPLPPQFVTIKRKFTLVLVSNTSHCGSNAHTTPGAKIDDGYLHIVLIGEVTRIELIEILWGFESGRYIKHPSVFRQMTKAVRFIPQSHDDIVTADGERILLQPVQCTILPSAINILCSQKAKL